MAIPPILILGGAGALLLYLFSGDKKAETPEAEEDDTKSKDLDLDVVVKQPAGVVNGTCPGYTEMGMAEAQGILKKMNYKGADGKALAADGKWGANTKFAMMDYQKVKGLAVDGYLGKQTGDALKNSLTADIVGPPPAADAGAVSEQFGYKDGFESKGQGYNFDALCANIGSGCNKTRYDKGFNAGAYEAGVKEGAGVASLGYTSPLEGNTNSAVMGPYNSSSSPSWKAGFKKGYEGTKAKPTTKGGWWTTASANTCYMNGKNAARKDLITAVPYYFSAYPGPKDGGTCNTEYDLGYQKGWAEGPEAAKSATDGSGLDSGMSDTDVSLADALTTPSYDPSAGVTGEFWAKVGATVDMQRQGVVMARARRAAGDQVEATGGNTVREGSAYRYACYKAGMEVAARDLTNGLPYYTSKYEYGAGAYNAECNKAFDIGYREAWAAGTAQPTLPQSPEPPSWGRGEQTRTAMKQYGAWGRLS